MSKKIFHLSHNDGDGYGSQVVTNQMARKGMQLFDFSTDNIQSYNANYYYLEEMADLIIEEMQKEPVEDEKLLFITDLNIKDINYIKKIMPKLEAMNAKIQLIDHHATSKEISENYNWYNVQDKDCATKEVVKCFANSNKGVKQKDIQESIDIANHIDHYDLYKRPQSEEWLNGSFLHDLAYKLARVFPYAIPLKTYLDYKKNPEKFENSEEIKKELLTAKINNNKYTTEIFEKVFKLLQDNVPVLDIDNKHLNEMYEEIIRRDYPQSDLKSEVLSWAFLSSEEKLVYLNKELLGIDSNRLERIQQKIDTLNVDNIDETQLNVLIEEMKKQLNFKLGLLLPKGLEKEREYIYKKYENEIVDRELLMGADEANEWLDKKIREETKKLVLGNEDLNKIPQNIDFLKNEKVPNFMQIASTMGIKAIEESIVLRMQDDEIGTKIKIVLNSPGSFFQHASHAYNNVKEKGVLTNFNTNGVTMSSRANNEKAGPLMKKQGGGGHGNAGGCFFKDLIPQKNLEIRKSKTESKEVKKANEKEIETILLKAIEEKMNIVIPNKKKSKANTQQI